MRLLTGAHPSVGIAALIFVDVDLGVGRMAWLLVTPAGGMDYFSVAPQQAGHCTI
jgi:hypothetical protein